MNLLGLIQPIETALNWLDAHPTISNTIAGTFSGAFTVFLAIYVAQNWILRPKFKVEVRNETDGPSKALVITSLRQGFSPDEVHLLIIMEKEVFNKKPSIQILEGKMGWIPLKCDTPQDKNILKRPYKVLSMTIPQTMHTNAPTIVLMFGKFDGPLEIYYTLRTKFGPFPKNDSPKIVESGKLPKIKIF